MKNIYKIIFIALAVFTVGCTDNPLEDLEGKGWQKERNILSILIEGQIGTAVIERNFDDAEIKVYAKLENIADIANVEIKDIEFSYGSTSLNSANTTLDFTSGTSTISVVSGAGETLNWKVTLLPFNSDLEGTWYIGDVRMYCDMFTWESWGWEKNESVFGYLPELNPEWDNVITFTVEGADENGNPFGAYEHSAGNDGEFGSFTDTGKGWNFNERFRKVPEGEGTWLRDFKRNVLVITDSNNQTHELSLELFADTGDVEISAEVPYLAELFSWTDTDWSYEELAHMSKLTWYRLTKERVLQTGNSITSFSVKDQEGAAQIDADNKKVTVLIPDNGADLSTIEITGLEVSYGATTNVSVGNTLDFSTNNTSSIVVTSEAGEAADWTINLVVEVAPGESIIEGTWNIDQIGMYCDLFTWESWGWDKYVPITDYLAEAIPEQDNKIIFVLSGTNGDGTQYGTFENNTGTDGEYGDFVDTSKGWDFNHRFRTVPTASGTWLLEEMKLTITTDGGDIYILDVEEGLTANEISITSPVEFLSENFNWTDTDYNYEELAHMSKKMWYNLSK